MINKVLGRTHNKSSNPFLSNQKILSGALEIAEGFNNFFADIGPNLAKKIQNSKFSFADFLPAEVPHNFTFQNVTSEILSLDLSRMKNKNSAGLDNIKDCKVFLIWQ